MKFSNIKRIFQLSSETAPQLVESYVGSSNTPPVSKDSVIGIPEYFCGVSTISSSIAATTPNIIRKTTGLPVSTNDKYQKLFTDGFNEVHSGFISVELVMWHLLTFGHYGARVIEDEGTFQLYPLLPEYMDAKVEHGRLTVLYSNPNGSSGAQEQLIPGKDCIYIVGYSRDGITGLTPLQMFKDTFTNNLETSAYGRKFFKNASVPNLVISTENSLTAEEREEFATSFAQATGGNDMRSTILLPHGGKIEPLSINPVDAELLASRMYNLRDICRILNIPASRLHDTSQATYSNIGEEGLDFVRRTLTPWMRRIESAFNKQFLPTHLELRFDPTKLAEGGLKDQFEAWKVGIDSGIIDAEHAAARMGMPAPDKKETTPPVAPQVVAPTPPEEEE